MAFSGSAAVASFNACRGLGDGAAMGLEITRERAEILQGLRRFVVEQCQLSADFLRGRVVLDRHICHLRDELGDARHQRML